MRGVYVMVSLLQQPEGPEDSRPACLRPEEERLAEATYTCYPS